MIKAGIPAAEAAALLSAFFAAFLAGRLVLTLVGHLIAPFALFTGAVSFTALCALGCALADPVWFYPPAGLGVGLFFPGFFVTATAKMGTDARVAPVILGTCQIGAVLAPLIVAGLTAPMGERGYFWLMAAIAGGLAVLALVFYRPMSRHG